MRQFNTKADYYACILESAEKTLTSDPEDVLHREVTQNISGGHLMWDSGADALFEKPQTLEEGLLALELRKVLEIAIENQLRCLRKQERAGEINWDIFGFSMDYSLLLGSVPKLARRDAHRAMHAKLEMAAIAMRTKQEALPVFIGKRCCGRPEDGEYFCNQF